MNAAQKRLQTLAAVAIQVVSIGAGCGWGTPAWTADLALDAPQDDLPQADDANIVADDGGGTDAVADLADANPADMPDVADGDPGEACTGACPCEGAACAVRISGDTMTQVGLVGSRGSVAALPDDGFVVAWQGLDTSLPKHIVSAVRFGKPRSGPGPLLTVSAAALPDDGHTTVAALPDGRFAVAWQSKNPLSQGSRAFMRRYDSDGKEAGPEEEVDENANGMQPEPILGALLTESYVVSWRQYVGSSTIVARKYSAEGAVAWFLKVGGPTSWGPDFVAGLADGRAVIGWRHDGHPAWAVNPDGSLGGEYWGLCDLPCDQVSAVPLGDARLLAVWTVGDNLDGDSNGVFARRFDLAGNPDGAAFQVNEYVLGSQDQPVAAAFADGSVLVVWESAGGDTSHPGGIYGKRFSANGDTLGSEVRVLPASVGGAGTDIAAFPDGGYVVVWSTGSAIYAMRFASDGNPVPL